MNSRRLALRWTAVGAALAAATLAGCASFKTVTSEVSTFGEWPAGRPAGSYVIERLPSQQAAPGGLQADVEQAAHQALQTAGFVPAATGATPDVVVQIGARITRYDRSPWDDPLWWRPYGSRWAGPGWPGGWGPYGPWRWRNTEPSEYQREVGLLIRDKASGQPLYEARAHTDGITAGGPPVIAAMFSAALKEFPKARNEPHDVDIQLP
ncbi:DUF4136 domain-containing protein [Ideonella sp.]|uniref:DUF4136 domain-containing protein n=1 Tax=Ideonella sp. TaxID=1929293 RepID=UPI0035AE9B70